MHLPTEAEIAAAHADGVRDLADHGFTQPAQLPDSRTNGCDHAEGDGCYRCCSTCNADRHTCPGCGANLTHGQTACAACHALPDTEHDPLFFNPDGTFKTPELAAFHAIQVQGGFSTPAREARRMLRDNAANAMARKWLEDRGLSLDGDEEPSPFPGQLMRDGMLIEPPATQFAQPAREVTPAEAATAQVLDDLPAPPVAVDLDKLADPAPLAWYQAIAGWDDEIADLTEKRDRAVQIIQDAMGDADEARIGGRPAITWKTSKPTMRLDRKALESDHGEEFVAQYLRPAKAARPFRILPRRGAR